MATGASATPEEDLKALAAELGPDTLFGQTVADRRSWLLLPRVAAIEAGHPRSLGIMVVDQELMAEPEAGLRRIAAWLQQLLIEDPVAAARAAREVRASIDVARAGNRWHAWDEEALAFAALFLGEGVIFAAETIKGSPLSRDERTELYAGVRALALLVGADPELVPDDDDAFRDWTRRQLDEVVEMRPVMRIIATQEPPKPAGVSERRWRITQRSGRHLLRVLLATTLPDITRERYGLRPTRRDRIEGRTLLLGLRAFGRLPEGVRLMAPARRRRRGLSGPGEADRKRRVPV